MSLNTMLEKARKLCESVADLFGHIRLNTYVQQSLKKHMTIVRLQNRNFPSSSFTHLLRLVAKQSGNFTDLINAQNYQRSSLVDVYKACGLAPLSYVFSKCNSFLIFISLRSSLALSMSLDFPSIESKVPPILSNIFLSVYA